MKRQLSKKRSETLQKLIQDHEPEIRKITSKRKNIADQINKLKQEDKELCKQQTELMKKRDEVVETKRQELRLLK